MARIVSSATMSLDGFIANPDDTVGPLFDWFDAGDVALASANPRVSFHLTEPSAAYWRSWTERIGCVLVGRRLFDITDGWGGVHPLGAPVVVVTHAAPEGWAPPGAETVRFVTTGVADALDVAASIAGDGVVAVAAGTIAGQALGLGRIDDVAIDLVPVVLGAGKRYFGEARHPAVRLGDPTTRIDAPGVTHLVHPVLRDRPGSHPVGGCSLPA
jgi:dihydrofolate reductase